MTRSEQRSSTDHTVHAEERSKRVSLWAIFSLLPAACVVDDVVGTMDAAPDEVEGCQLDSVNGPLSAGSMTRLDDPDRWEAQGFICPLGDKDWYTLTVPGGHRLVRVSLSVRGPVSPIQPAFAIYECDEPCLRERSDDEDAHLYCCSALVNADLPSVEEGIDAVHCVDTGDYFFVVSDFGDDNVDSRYPRGEYMASVTTLPDPDPHELNESSESPARLQEAGVQSWSVDGQVACRGDEDWFVLDESDGADLSIGGSLTVTLDLSSPASFHPQLRVLDDAREVLTVQRNLSAPQEPTHLSWTGPILSPGPYYFVVEDDDDHDADTVSYELAVSISPP